MNRFFPEIKKNFGFGMMRLPMIGDKVDLEQTQKMVDYFLGNGFNYFDTAHPYIQGQSELAIKECLTSKYPRDAYILTNKLSTQFFEKEEDIRPLFETQLECCGVDYFDFYLMHAQNEKVYPKYKAARAYDIAQELKAEGKVRHVGLSFHGTAKFLDELLTERPEIEVVQLQFNYLNYEDPAVQSLECYKVCEKHGKPVLVMEPIKGGSLINLPEEAQKIYDGLGRGSNASYAIRFVAGHGNVAVVLSGMSTYEQMLDNVSFMKDFKPLDEEEREAVRKVVDVYHSMNLIKCTGCRYCTDGCPMQIKIPDLFACFNSRKVKKLWNNQTYYNVHTSDGHGRAADCIKCGACEAICPQGLPIRDLLEEVSAEFDN